MNLPRGAKPGRSAGVLLYRWIASPADAAKALEVYLVHPGGPYFKGKDVWGIAKGLIENGEDEETTARREFAEETGFPAPERLFDIGTITTGHGKVIHAFAGEWTSPGDPPPVDSNYCTAEWPRGSGTIIEVPEVDEGRFFGFPEAEDRMRGCQDAFLGRLRELLEGEC